MESTYKVSERIVSSLCPNKADEERANAICGVNQNIKYLIEDVLKMVKNINETSLPGKDRMDRIIEMETKFGIPKTHIL